jgi:hypothetical protein
MHVASITDETGVFIQTNQNRPIQRGQLNVKSCELEWIRNSRIDLYLKGNIQLQPQILKCTIFADLIQPAHILIGKTRQYGL